MSDPMQSVVQAYFDAFCRFDRAAWVALFAEDSSLGGPAHTPPVVGRAALGAMYDAITGLFTAIDFRPEHVLVEESFAVAHFSLKARAKNGRDTQARGFVAFAADERGLLTQVAGYWNPAPLLAEAISPAPVART